MEKIPQSIEAEMSVLGSILIDPEVIVQIADRLSPTDFYRDSHRIIYEAVIYLLERHEPADFITLCDELERMDKLDTVGGASYITSLINYVPTSGNAEYYAGIVVRMAEMRRLAHVAGQIAALAYNKDETAVEQAEQLLYAVSEHRSTRDFSTGTQAVEECWANLMALRDNKRELVGVPTGSRALDFYLGGLQPSDLIIVAGRPGIGKSAWAFSLVYHLLVNTDMRVAVFSLEMSQQQIMQRLISYDSHIDLYRLRNGHIREDEWDKLSAACTRLSTDRLCIDDTGQITSAALRSKARRLHASAGLDLIVVDYLQLMKGNEGNKNRNREQEIAEISSGLKALAKELRVPVLALAQVNRGVESRADKRPMLSDLRESGSIENDADVVMFAYREEYYTPETPRKGIAEIAIAKHRNGPIGTVEMRFVASETRFEEIGEA